MGLITTFRPSEQKKAVFFQSLITMKVLVATEKPFAKAAVDGIREIVQGAGYQMALLEKYTDTNQLLTAVQDADALIVRSDKVTAEVAAAAPQLKIVVRAGADTQRRFGCLHIAGIVVMNTPGQNSKCGGRVGYRYDDLHGPHQFTLGTGTEIRGKRLGISGAYGHVGRLVGRYGKAMGMEVRPILMQILSGVRRRRVRVMDTVEVLYEQSGLPLAAYSGDGTDQKRRSVTVCVDPDALAALRWSIPPARR